MSGRLPNFVIIGAMKCGTSTLHDQLAAQTAFFMSTPKETNFFSDDSVWSRGLAWYEGLFAEAPAGSICGESSTHYTKLPTYPRTVERMAPHLRHARLVYVMRHPIERIVSQYIHEWSQREVREAFSRAIQRHERYVAYSSYARQIEPFLERWGPSRVLPVFFEQLVESPEAELRRICGFLGDPDADQARWRQEHAHANPSSVRMRRSAMREALLRVPFLTRLKDRLPRGWREAAKSLWQMRSRPQIPPRIRAEIEAAIDADLRRLSDWLGVPLSCAAWRESVIGAPPPQWSDRAPESVA